MGVGGGGAVITASRFTSQLKSFRTTLGLSSSQLQVRSGMNNRLLQITSVQPVPSIHVQD